MARGSYTLLLGLLALAWLRLAFGRSELDNLGPIVDLAMMNTARATRYVTETSRVLAETRQVQLLANAGNNHVGVNPQGLVQWLGQPGAVANSALTAVKDGLHVVEHCMSTGWAWTPWWLRAVLVPTTNMPLLALYYASVLAIVFTALHLKARRLDPALENMDDVGAAGMLHNGLSAVQRWLGWGGEGGGADDASGTTQGTSHVQVITLAFFLAAASSLGTRQLVLPREQSLLGYHVTVDYAGLHPLDIHPHHAPFPDLWASAARPTKITDINFVSFYNATAPAVAPLRAAPLPPSTPLFYHGGARELRRVLPRLDRCSTSPDGALALLATPTAAPMATQSLAPLHHAALHLHLHADAPTTAVKAPSWPSPAPTRPPHWTRLVSLLAPIPDLRAGYGLGVQLSTREEPQHAMADDTSALSSKATSTVLPNGTTATPRALPCLLQRGRDLMSRSLSWGMAQLTQRLPEDQPCWDVRKIGTTAVVMTGATSVVDGLSTSNFNATTPSTPTLLLWVLRGLGLGVDLSPFAEELQHAMADDTSALFSKATSTVLPNGTTATPLALACLLQRGRELMSRSLSWGMAQLTQRLPEEQPCWDIRRTGTTAAVVTGAATVMDSLSTSNSNATTPSTPTLLLWVLRGLGLGVDLSPFAEEPQHTMANGNYSRAEHATSGTSGVLPSAAPLPVAHRMSPTSTLPAHDEPEYSSAPSEQSVFELQRDLQLLFTPEPALTWLGGWWAIYLAIFAIFAMWMVATSVGRRGSITTAPRVPDLPPSALALVAVTSCVVPANSGRQEDLRKVRAQLRLAVVLLRSPIPPSASRQDLQLQAKMLHFFLRCASRAASRYQHSDERLAKVATQVGLVLQWRLNMIERKMRSGPPAPSSLVWTTPRWPLLFRLFNALPTFTPSAARLKLPAQRAEGASGAAAGSLVNSLAPSSVATDGVLLLESGVSSSSSSSALLPAQSTSGDGDELPALPEMPTSTATDAMSADVTLTVTTYDLSVEPPGVELAEGGAAAAVGVVVEAAAALEDTTIELPTTVASASAPSSSPASSASSAEVGGGQVVGDVEPEAKEEALESAIDLNTNPSHSNSNVVSTAASVSASSNEISTSILETQVVSSVAEVAVEATADVSTTALTEAPDVGPVEGVPGTGVATAGVQLPASSAADTGAELATDVSLVASSSSVLSAPEASATDLALLASSSSLLSAPEASAGDNALAGGAGAGAGAEGARGTSTGSAVAQASKNGQALATLDMARLMQALGKEKLLEAQTAPKAASKGGRRGASSCTASGGSSSTSGKGGARGGGERDSAYMERLRKSQAVFSQTSKRKSGEAKPPQSTSTSSPTEGAEGGGAEPSEPVNPLAAFRRALTAHRGVTTVRGDDQAPATEATAQPTQGHVSVVRRRPPTSSATDAVQPGAAVARGKGFNTASAPTPVSRPAVATLEPLPLREALAAPSQARGQSVRSDAEYSKGHRDGEGRNVHKRGGGKKKAPNPKT